MERGHKIREVLKGSIAEELELEAGDILLAINGNRIKDVFDYHYYMNDEYLTVLIQKANGEEWELEIEKEYEDDLGLEFDQGLMDEYRSCHNKCIFCFIDQMPPNMRETLYFKDDDARLSFLQGNYITLTNLKEYDIERIIKYKLSPVNISIQSMNPELRCKLLNNRFAGKSLEILKRFADAGIEMNSQIVLCKGYNDGEELDFSISELTKFIPSMRSLSVVPAGLTKYRDNLPKIEKYTKEEAKVILTQIEKWQEKLFKEHGTHFVFASDEWYLMAEKEIPNEAFYEGYGQIENGVGMVRSLLQEVDDYIEELSKTAPKKNNRSIQKLVSLATGKLATPILEEIVQKVNCISPNIRGKVYMIENDFFGHDITVAGLLTGQDIIAQLKDKQLGDYLILPQVLLRNGEDVLLDDLTIKDLERELNISIRIAGSSGKELIDTIIQ